MLAALRLGLRRLAFHGYAERRREGGRMVFFEGFWGVAVGIVLGFAAGLWPRSSRIS